MKLEHIALNVPDARGLAAWYVEHLGMKVVVARDEPPYMHFLADSVEQSMLEIYQNPAAAIPDYASMHPLMLHLAFLADDMEATRTRLIAAGATPAGEISTNPSGDQLTFLRDPWGITVQLIKRHKPLL